MFDLTGPFGWETIPPERLQEMLDFLRVMEGRTPFEIFDAPGNRQTRGRGKFIPTDNLTRDAVRRLQDLGQDDIDGLWEIRKAYAKRVWGSRQGRVFHLLWWDPYHKVCTSN